MMIEVLLYIFGVISGIAMCKVYLYFYTPYGVIDVDVESGMCACKITSTEIANPKVKRVLFKVKHDAHIIDDSREEQSL